MGNAIMMENEKNIEEKVLIMENEQNVEDDRELPFLKEKLYKGTSGIAGVQGSRRQ